MWLNYFSDIETAYEIRSIIETLPEIHFWHQYHARSLVYG